MGQLFSVTAIQTANQLAADAERELAADAADNEFRCARDFGTLAETAMRPHKTQRGTPTVSDRATVVINKDGVSAAAAKTSWAALDVQLPLFDVYASRAGCNVYGYGTQMAEDAGAAIAEAQRVYGTAGTGTSVRFDFTSEMDAYIKADSSAKATDSVIGKNGKCKGIADVVSSCLGSNPSFKEPAEQKACQEEFAAEARRMINGEAVSRRVDGSHCPRMSSDSRHVRTMINSCESIQAGEEPDGACVRCTNAFDRSGRSCSWCDGLKRCTAGRRHCGGGLAAEGIVTDPAQCPAKRTKMDSGGSCSDVGETPLGLSNLKRCSLCAAASDILGKRCVFCTLDRSFANAVGSVSSKSVENTCMSETETKLSCQQAVTK